MKAGLYLCPGPTLLSEPLTPSCPWNSPSTANLEPSGASPVPGFMRAALQEQPRLPGLCALDGDVPKLADLLEGLHYHALALADGSALPLVYYTTMTCDSPDCMTATWASVRLVRR